MVNDHGRHATGQREVLGNLKHAMAQLSLKLAKSAEDTRLAQHQADQAIKEAQLARYAP